MAGTIHQLRQERRNKLLAKHSIQSTNRRPPPPPPGRLPPPPPPSKFQVGTAGTSEDESESDDDVIDFTVGPTRLKGQLPPPPPPARCNKSASEKNKMPPPPPPPRRKLLSMINEHEQVPEHNNELEQVIRSGEGHIEKCSFELQSSASPPRVSLDEKETLPDQSISNIYLEKDREMGQTSLVENHTSSDMRGSAHESSDRRSQDTPPPPSASPPPTCSPAFKPAPPPLVPPAPEGYEAPPPPSPLEGEKDKIVDFKEETKHGYGERQNVHQIVDEGNEHVQENGYFDQSVSKNEAVAGSLASQNENDPAQINMEEIPGAIAAKIVSLSSAIRDLEEKSREDSARVREVLTRREDEVRELRGRILQLEEENLTMRDELSRTCDKTVSGLERIRNEYPALADEIDVIMKDIEAALEFKEARIQNLLSEVRLLQAEVARLRVSTETTRRAGSSLDVTSAVAANTSLSSPVAPSGRRRFGGSPRELRREDLEDLSKDALIEQLLQARAQLSKTDKEYFLVPRLVPNLADSM